MFTRPCTIVMVEKLKTNLLSPAILFHFLWSLQHGHYSDPDEPNLQHKTNREQNDWCGNLTAQSQAPDDGYINDQNMLST